MSLRINHSGDSSDTPAFELSNGQSSDVNPNDPFKNSNPGTIAKLIPEPSTRGSADAHDAPIVDENPITGQENPAVVLDRDSFEQAFSDFGDGDILESIRIDSQPERGNLRLGDTILSVGQTVFTEQLSQLVFQPAEDWNGRSEFRWSGFDGTDWSAHSATVSIDIESINDAPVATVSIGARTANQDAAFSFALPNGLFCEVDAGDSITLSAKLPDWLSFDAAAGTITGVPAYQNIGSHRIAITGTDRTGASATVHFDLAVENVNDRPSFSRIADVFTNEYDPLDVDAGANLAYELATSGDGLTYAASLADGSELPDWIQIDQLTGRVTGTPPQGMDTNVEIRVTATDASETSASSVFKLLIASGSDALGLTGEIDDAAATVDNTFHFDVSTSFAGTGLADARTFSASLPDGTALPDWLKFDPATGVFSGVPESDNVGMIPITVTAIDGSKSVQDTFAVIVLNTSDGPVASGVANQKTRKVEPFSLDVSRSFRDLVAGDARTYTATLTNGSDLPDWLQFDEATGVFSGVPEKGDVGGLSILVVASDGVANANAIFSIEVENTNDSPVASYLPPQSIEEDRIFLFDASTAFSDKDRGDELTYSATLENGEPLPPWISLNRFSGELSGTPQNVNAGTLSIIVAGSDCISSASRSFTIEVQNANDGPIVSTSISSPWASEDTAFEWDIEESSFDDDFADTPPHGTLGTASVAIATEGAESEASASFSIETSNTNDIATIDDHQEAAENKTFLFDAKTTFSDPNLGETLALQATLSNGAPLPSWLAFDETSGLFSGVPGNDDIGTIEVAVTATDGDSLVQSAFCITVENASHGPTAHADFTSA